MIFFALNAPGGSASVFLSLAKSLQEKGNTVDIYTYYFDKKLCFPEITKYLHVTAVQNTTIDDYILNNRSILARFTMASDYYFKSKELGKLLLKKKYDVIYASEASSYMAGFVYTQKYPVPLFWSVFDPISLVDNKRPGMLINKHTWFGVLLQIHNFFDSKNIKKITKVIVPTTHMKNMLDRFYSINSIVLPTAGVRIEDFSTNKTSVIKKRLKDKFGFEKKREIILYGNGHILPHRRYEDVLEALLLLKKDFRLRYIISGSDKFDSVYTASLRRKVEELDLADSVIFDTEFKSNEEIIGYYQYADIFVFVSTEQTWGLAPFEAMAAKKPVIISKGVGASEVLAENVNAYIVHEKSPKEIANAVRNILTNKKKAHIIAGNGYKRAKDFSYVEIAKRVEKLMQPYLERD